MKTKVYIGSTNKVKVSAVEEVFDSTIFEVISLESTSNVSNQPLTDEETLTGAKNRALNIIEEGIKIGLEAGVEILNDILFLTNYGVLIDQDNNIYYAGGTRIPLPDVIKDAIFNEGLELSDAMNKYFQQKNIKFTNGSTGYFTGNQVQRKDVFVHIVKLLYGQYLVGRK